MKHTIKLTELQKKRFAELNNQLQQLQAQGTFIVETILDCANKKIDPAGKWQLKNENEIEVDILTEKK